MIPYTHYDHMRQQADMNLQMRIVSACVAGEGIGYEVLAALGPTNPALVNQTIFAADWIRVGRPHFYVEPKLSRSFDMTSIDNVPVDSVKLPYRTIYMSFSETGQRVWNRESGIHDLRGAYVHEEPGKIMFSLWGSPRKDARNASDDAIFNFTVDYDGVRATGSWERYLSSSIEDATWRSDVTYEEYVEGKLGPTQVVVRAAAKGNPEDVHINGRTSQWVLRQALNTVLYIQTQSPDMETVSFEGRYQDLVESAERKRNPAKRRALLQQAEKLPRGQVVVLGRRYVPRQERATGVVGGSAVRPHWRRGHFHRYWVGARLSEEGDAQPGTHMETRWVEPVWVGSGEPEGGVTYHVK